MLNRLICARVPATDDLPPALLGRDALLSPLAFPPLAAFLFLPSASFMGVLAEQSTLSCTGLNMRGSMRGGRSSSWKLPRRSFVCRLTLVCSTAKHEDQQQLCVQAAFDLQQRATFAKLVCIGYAHVLSHRIQALSAHSATQPALPILLC